MDNVVANRSSPVGGVTEGREFPEYRGEGGLEGWQLDGSERAGWYGTAASHVEVGGGIEKKLALDVHHEVVAVQKISA